MASIMACVVIASPDSASTLAAASRALAFLGLACVGGFFVLVLAGAAGSGATSAGLVGSGALSTDAGPAATVSGAGGTIASAGGWLAAAASGWSCGSVGTGTGTSGGSAGLVRFFGLAGLFC